MSKQSDILPALLSQSSWARRLARSLVTDGASVDDVLQEAWIAAMSRPPGTDWSIRGWLTTVMRNVVRDSRRAESRRRGREVGVHDAETAAVDQEKLLLRLETRRLLAELVSQLDEPFRQTILLRYFEDRSAAEIARALGIPAGTVRWRLKTGLDRLRTRLDEREPGGRRSWVLALTPLAEPGELPGWLAPGVLLRTAMKRKVMAGAAALLLLLAGYALWQKTRGGGSPGGSSGPVEPGGALASQGDRKRPSRAAIAPPRLKGDWEGCRREVDQMRTQLAKIDEELRRTIPLGRIFSKGEPNTSLEGEVGPQVARILGDITPAPSGHSIECRGSVCKLSVVEKTKPSGPYLRGSGSRDWMSRVFSETGKLGEVNNRSPRPFTDPLSGESGYVTVVYLQFPVLQAASQPALSSDSGTRDWSFCEAQRRGLETTLKEKGASILQHRWLREWVTAKKFPSLTPNPALTEEVRSQIRRVLGDTQDGWVSRFECRAESQCLALAAAELNQRILDDIKRLRQDEWFHRRMKIEFTLLKEGGFADWTTSDISPAPKEARIVPLFSTTPDHSEGKELLDEAMKNLIGSSAMVVCERGFPQTGNWEVWLEAPDLVQENEPGTISASFGGKVAGTPLGRCLEAAFTQALAAIPVPSPLRGAELTRTFQFPTRR